MYGYVYLTTNLINGKKYIGQHKYSGPGIDKDYLGSGKILEQAILKEGKTNFSCEVIEYCKNQIILNEREIYWINYYDAVNSEEFYNIVPGGLGRQEGYKMPEEAIHKMKTSHTGLRRINNGEREKLVKSEEVDYWITRGWKLGCKSDYWKKGAFKNCKGQNNPMYGRKHTEETKQKLADLKRGTIPYNKGKEGYAKNSKWIYNIHSLKSRMVHSPELEKLLDSGEWKLGRYPSSSTTIEMNSSK